MKSLTARIKSFLLEEDGPTAVEYAIMLAMIVMACLAGIQAVGTNANVKFQDTANGLS